MCYVQRCSLFLYQLSIRFAHGRVVDDCIIRHQLEVEAEEHSDQGTSTAKSGIGQSSAEMADSPGDWLLQPAPNPCNHHGPETAVRLQFSSLMKVNNSDSVHTPESCTEYTCMYTVWSFSLIDRGLDHQLNSRLCQSPTKSRPVRILVRAGVGRDGGTQRGRADRDTATHPSTASGAGLRRPAGCRLHTFKPRIWSVGWLLAKRTKKRPWFTVAYYVQLGSGRAQ